MSVQCFNGRVDARRNLGDGRSKATLRVLLQLVHSFQGSVEAVPVDDLSKSFGSGCIRRELRLKIADDEVGDAHVLGNDVADESVRAPIAGDRESGDRQAQPFLIDLSGVCAQTGVGATDVYVMGGGGGESNEFALYVNGREQVDVLQVLTAGKGIVQQQGIVRSEGVRIEALERLLKCQRDAGRHDRNALGLCDDRTASIG